MINYPKVYYRDLKNDFANSNDWKNCQKIILNVLPLLTLEPTLRRPLSAMMSGVRSLTHLQEMVATFQQNNKKEACVHALHASLATAALGSFFLNPVSCYFFSSISDSIIHLRSSIENPEAKNLALASLDVLFLASMCYGAIEITVACTLLQISLELCQSVHHLKKEKYLEGICQALLALGHIHQTVPQMKVLQWKWDHHPVLNAELKQNAKGFVYLDIPDEDVYTLFESLKVQQAELPPYFGKEQAGAHVTVIPIREWRMHGSFPIEELGTRFPFRIAHMDSMSPAGWPGVNKVHFLALSSPELEAMRTRYHLPSKVNDTHDFHITFALIPKN